MINNDRQYRIVKSQIDNFQKALEALSAKVEDVHPKILQAEKDAISYQIQFFMAEAREYEDLKAGNILVTAVKDLKELPLVLIRARIANGLTQADLASRLNMKEQQVQKYEAELYQSVSLRTLLRIANELKITVDADFQIREPERNGAIDGSRYPIKQMYKRHWFPDFVGSMNDAIKNSGELVLGLYQKAGIENRQLALNRRVVRSNAQFNIEALDVWYAQVMIKAREQVLESFFDKKFVNEEWFKHLASYTIKENGPELAVDFLKDSGIRVVFESHLEGTHLDGAALLIDKLFPVIAMTLRYDRLDNFWFVLFHELAHIILHLDADLDAIFDDLDAHVDGIERDADSFALNLAVPESVWKKSLVRFSPSDETIINQAKSLHVHPAIIAGRIRWETRDFYRFTNLVGQGEVRKKFTEELN